MSFLKSTESLQSISSMQNNSRNEALAILSMLLHELSSGRGIAETVLRDGDVTTTPVLGPPEAIFRDALFDLHAHLQRGKAIPSYSNSNSNQQSISLAPVASGQINDSIEANHSLTLARLVAHHISLEIGGLYLRQAIRKDEVGSNGKCRVRNCHICGDDSDSTGAKFSILTLLDLPDGHQSCHDCVGASFEHMSPSNILTLFGKDVSAHAFALFFPAERVAAWQGVIDREIARERLLALRNEEALNATRNEEQKATNDDALRELAAKEGWMRCPNHGCQVWVSKEVGCHHMTCTLCSQEFCYMCGATWRPRKCNCNPGYQFAVQDAEADARLAATFEIGFNQPLHGEPVSVFRAGRVQLPTLEGNFYRIQHNSRVLRRRQRLVRRQGCCPRQ